MNAVDTNIILYSLDKNEPVKHAKAEALFRQLGATGAPTVLFWQVLAESVQQLRRWKNKGDLTDAEFVKHVQTVRSAFSGCRFFQSMGVLDHALDLANRYSLSHWDSMILGACKEASITTLYTEDMGSPTTVDGIQLINPLL